MLGLVTGAPLLCACGVTGEPLASLCGVTGAFIVGALVSSLLSGHDHWVASWLTAWGVFLNSHCAVRVYLLLCFLLLLVRLVVPLSRLECGYGTRRCRIFEGGFVFRHRQQV